MNKLIFSLAGVLCLTAFPAFAGDSSRSSILQSTATTGNGAPSGAHYNLNIIGVENPKTDPMTGGDGHTISSRSAPRSLPIRSRATSG
ncbi:MAG TPA: hypothetical protein VFS34_09885 [Thermoanaerobaculia bacterium]|nr:hypothetical protein [Thermoanaerobaculia bacterium]